MKMTHIHQVTLHRVRYGWVIGDESGLYRTRWDAERELEIRGYVPEMYGRTWSLVTGDDVKVGWDT